MALLAAALMVVAALALALLALLGQKRRERQVAQRLQGHLVRDNKLGSWLRLLGDIRFGQRSVSLDN